MGTEIKDSGCNQNFNPTKSAAIALAGIVLGIFLANLSIVLPIFSVDGFEFILKVLISISSFIGIALMFKGVYTLNKIDSEPIDENLYYRLKEQASIQVATHEYGEENVWIYKALQSIQRLEAIERNSSLTSIIDSLNEIIRRIKQNPGRMPVNHTFFSELLPRIVQNAEDYAQVKALRKSNSTKIRLKDTMDRSAISCKIYLNEIIAEDSLMIEAKAKSLDTLLNMEFGHAITQDYRENARKRI